VNGVAELFCIAFPAVTAYQFAEGDRKLKKGQKTLWGGRGGTQVTELKVADSLWG